jgi:hypothetical protein
LAVENPWLAQPDWNRPSWPDQLPDSGDLRLIYGEVADELVVLFDAKLHRDSWFDWVATPEYEYAAIKIDGTSGQVIGVLVEHLVAYAVEKHPAWLAAAASEPNPEVASRIVNDIKDLFDRYGTEPSEPERD